MKTLIVGVSGSGKTTEALRIAWSHVVENRRVVFASAEATIDYVDDLLSRNVDDYREELLGDTLRFLKVNFDLTRNDVENIENAFGKFQADVLIIDAADGLGIFEDFEEVYQTAQVGDITGIDIDIESIKSNIGVDEVIVCGR